MRPDAFSTISARELTKTIKDYGVFISNNPQKCSFIELTEESGSLKDPDAREFLRGHLDCDNKVGGLAGRAEHTRSHRGLVDGATVLFGVGFIVLDWFKPDERHA